MRNYRNGHCKHAESIIQVYPLCNVLRIFPVLQYLACATILSVFSSTDVDCGFDFLSVQTRDYKIGIYYLHAAFRSKSI